MTFMTKYFETSLKVLNNFPPFDNGLKALSLSIVRFAPSHEDVENDEDGN